MKIVSKKKNLNVLGDLWKIDEYIIDYACEDACVKVPNVKSIKKCSSMADVDQGGGGGGEVSSANNNTLHVASCCASRVRGGEERLLVWVEQWTQARSPPYT